MNIKSLVFLISFVGITFAGPILDPTSSTKCAKECHKGGTTKFLFKPGTSYVYKYDTSTHLSLNDKSTQVDINGEAAITPFDECEYSLKFTKIKVNGVANYEDLEKALTKNQIKFAFNDGNIDHICHDVEEPMWVLNVKKAVLSAFKVSIGQFEGLRIVDETDIFGECTTQYNSISKSFAEGTQIKKTKNLLTCQHYIDYQFAPFMHAMMEKESKPIFACDQVVGTNGILKSVHCEEVLHLHNNSSSKFEKMSKLSLVFDSSKNNLITDNLKEFKTSSLLFEREAKDPKSFDQVKALAKQLCKDVENSIQAETTEIIHKLAHSIKDVTYDQLIEIWDEITNEKECKSKRIKKIFINAVINSRSLTSINFMTKKLKPENLMCDKSYNYALWSLAFANQPCPYMVKAVTPLLSTLPSGQALFGLTAMIQKHKETHKDFSVEAIEAAINELVPSINVGKPAEAILRIRALGNIHHSTPLSNEKLLSYVKDSSLPSEIRVAAFDSLKNMDPTNNEIQKIAEDLMYNQKDASIEVRVAAYKYYIVSTDPIKVWNTVKDEKEDTNFVSFVKSHLFTVKHSLNLDKADIRQKLFDTKIPMIKLFDGPSLHFELSHMKNDRSVGALGEIDWVVKSGHLSPNFLVANISFPYGKHMLNVLEVGIVPKEGASFQNLINLKNLNLESLKKLATIKPKFIETVYLKWLGKTMFYYNPQQEAGQKNSHSSFGFFYENSPLVYLFEMGHSHIFFDRTYSYPSLNGLMVEISTRTVILNGLKISSNTKEEASNHKLSSFNIYRNLILDHERKLAVYVGGRNSKSKGGSTVKFLISTNFSINGNIESNGNKSNIIIDIDDEPMNLVTIEKSKHFHYFDGKKEEIKFNHEPKFMCSTAYTDKPLGIEFCLQKDTDNSMGNMLHKTYKMLLTMKKTDKSIKGYQLFKDVQKSPSKFNATFGFDVIGSSINRKSIINYYLEGDDKWKLPSKNKWIVNVQSPQHKFDAKANLNAQGYGESTFDLEYAVDDKNPHTFQGKINRKKTEDGTVNIKSNWKLNLPELSDPVDYDATFYFDKNKQLKTEILSNKNGKSENVFKLDYNKESNSVKESSRKKRSAQKDDLKTNLDLQIGEQKHNHWLNLNSELELEKNKDLEILIKLDYKNAKAEKQGVQFKTKLEKDFSNNQIKMKGKGSLMVSEYPHYNFKLDGKFNHVPKAEHESEFDLRWGEDQEKKKFYLLNSYKLSKYENEKNLKGAGTVKVNFMPKNFNHQLDYDVLLENYPAKVEVTLNHKNINSPQEIRKAVYRRSTDLQNPILTSIHSSYIFPKGEHHFDLETSKIEDNHYKRKGLYKLITPDGKESGYNMNGDLKLHSNLKSIVGEVTTFPHNHSVLKFDHQFEKGEKMLKAASSVFYKGGKVYSASYSSKDNNVDLSAEMNIIDYYFATHVAKNDSKDIHFMITSVDKKKNFDHMTDLTYSRNKREIRSKTNCTNNIVEFEWLCEQERKKVYLKVNDYLSFFWSQTMNANNIYRQFNLTYADNTNALDIFTERWNQDKNKYLSWNDIEQANVKLYLHNKPSKQMIKLTSNLDPKNFTLDYNRQKNGKSVASINGKVEKEKQFLLEAETEALKAFVEYMNEKSVKQAKLKFNSKVSEHKLEYDQVFHFETDTTGRTEANVDLFIPPNASLKTNHKSSYDWSGDNVKVTVNTKREVKIDKYDFVLENTGKGMFSKNVLAGPHTFTIKTDKNGKNIANGDLKYTANNGLMNGNLKIICDGKKYIEAQLDGKIEGSLKPSSEKGMLVGTIKVSSDYENLNDIHYSLDYTQEPKQQKLRVIRQKHGNTTHDLDYVSTKGNKKCHKQAKLTFVNPDKSKGVLDVELEYSNKLKLNASLMESIPSVAADNNVISELKVDIPLVSISKFIGNHAKMSFELPGQGSKIYAEYKAPTTNDIKLESGLIIQQEPFFVYNMNITESNKEKSKVKRSLETSSLLMKNFITIKGYPKLIENDITFSDDRIFYEGRTKPGIIKLSYNKLNDKTDKIFAEICSLNNGQMGSCGSVDVEKLKIENGHDYNILTKLKKSDGSVNKFQLKTLCKKDQKSHHFKLIGTYNDRTFGHECLKTMTEKEKLVTVKIYLPERSLQGKLETSNYTIDGSRVDDFVLNLWLDADRKVNQKMTIKRSKKTITNTEDNKKWNSQIEISHPVLEEPLKIDSTYNKETKNGEIMRSFETKLKYSKEDGKALNFKGSLVSSKTESNKGISYNVRVFQDDNMIDFGCEEVLKRNDLQDKSGLLRNKTCYWTDRNGVKKTASKHDSVFLSKNSKYFSIEADYNNPLFKHHYTGDLHLIDRNQASSTIDWFLENDKKQRTKISFNKTDASNCMLIDSSRISSDKETADYNLGICFLSANTFNDSLFEIFATEKQLTNNVWQSSNKFLVKILPIKSHPNDFLVSIKWDPGIFGTILVSLVEEVDQKRGEWQALMKEVEEELKHKNKLLKEGLVDKVISPMIKHLSQEKENLKKEMKPELDYIQKIINESIKRSKRSIKSNEVDPTVNKLEKMLDIKITVYNLEGGELEFIVKNFKSFYAYKRWSNIIQKVINDVKH